jgi:hypothetical protein
VPRVAVVGCGATGARAVRHLAAEPAVEELVLSGSSRTRLEALRGSIDAAARVSIGEPHGADIVVLAGPRGHARLAAELLDADAHVVSTSDDLDDVCALLDLDALAGERGRTLVAGAGFAPGLSGILAAHAAGTFDEVCEVHVARFGTGGPACARVHHDALRGRGLDWRRHAWLRRPAGSGRELAQFPDPIGGLDCYRARIPEAVLLQPAFPGIERITARQAANRRDRLTSWLPMLRRPHPEGRIGALRVEVRGTRDGAWITEVRGALEPPAVAAGAVAAVCAARLLAGDAPTGVIGALACGPPVELLRRLAELGVRGAIFDGTG